MTVRTSTIGFGTLAERPDCRDVVEGYRYVATDTGLTYRAARTRWDVLPVPGTAKVALGDADTAGGMLAWQNQSGMDLIVARMLVYLAVTLDDDEFGNNAHIGSAVNGTTSASNYHAGFGLDGPDSDGAPMLISGLDPATAAFVLPAGHYVTISTSSGSANGIAGFAYISFFPA